MFTTEDYENQEAAIGDRIYGEPVSKQERESSRKSFELSIQEAVKNGGKLEIEEFTTSKGVEVKNFSLRINHLELLSISKEQAINFCNYN